jgi:hypothetical protein
MVTEVAILAYAMGMATLPHRPADGTKCNLSVFQLPKFYNILAALTP